jgi:hypothetical protein
MSTEKAIKRADTEYASTIHVLPQPDVTLTVSHNFGKVYTHGIDIAGPTSLIEITATVRRAFLSVEERIIRDLAKQYGITVD